MNSKKIIGHLHKLYRTDPWIGELFGAAGVELDNLEETMDDIFKQYFFDTATAKGLDCYEKEAGLKSNSVMTDDDRRAALEAKWKSSGKVDLHLLQSVTDSWKNGEIEVSFVGGKIRIEFKGDYGVPKDIQSLKNALEEVKPSHLALIYAFRYLLIENIHEILTIAQIQSLTLDKFAR